MRASVENKVWFEIKRQHDEKREFITPYTVARALGYKLSGRISIYLNALEDRGLIYRTYKTANECFIHIGEKPE